MAARRLPAALLAAIVLGSMAPAASATGQPGALLQGTLELEVSEQVVAGNRLSASYEYFVRDDQGRQTRVTFAGEPPAGVEPGNKVRVAGRRSGTAVVAEGVTVLADTGSTGTASGEASTGVAMATATAPVTRKLAVILVNFAANPVQPYTPAYATGVFFTNTNSIAAYFNEDSHGKLALTGDVSGWFTIDYDTSVCDTAAIQSKAEAAATASGVVLANYTHVSFVFPHLDACSFAGRAQLPGTRSWINTISTTNPKIHDWVVSHELGHNFGVHHANSYSCTTGGVRVSLSATAADCTSTEYGDPHTVMGAWNPIAKYPTDHAWHRLQMGFMGTAERRDVTASGLYTLGSTAFAASSPKALRINRTGSTATRHWFELEFRRPGTLFDGFSSTSAVANGASIRLVADDSRRVQSWLIDATPATTSFSDAALAVGQTFTDPLSGIAITTKSTTTDAAGNPALKVKVLFPNTPPPSAPSAFAGTSSRDGLTATLSWKPAESQVGVAGYRIYRDDILVASLPASATGYTDPDRTPGATYAYRIEAVDWVDLVGAPATTSVLMYVPQLGTTTASFGGQPTSATLASTVTVTRALTITMGLHFSAPVTPPTKASLALSGTATGCTVAGVTGSGADYSISVGGCSEGTVAVTIGAGTVWDDMGYLAPNADASSDTFLIDRTAPLVSKPRTELRAGARLSGTGLPVRITFGASDAGSGVASHDVARSVDGGAWVTFRSATTATSLDATLAAGHTYRFRVRSRDTAGNVSAWVEGAILRPGLTQQTSTAITYRGTWYTANASSYSGGSVRYTPSSTATATYTVTGRGIALVTTTGPGRGTVKVYVDGAFVATVDLYAASHGYRVLAFSQMFSSYGTHTIKLVGLGTSGRPRVDLDAFAVIR